MILSKLQRKRALSALFLFLISCTTCHQWNLIETRADSPCFESARLYYAPEVMSCGLELELDCGTSGWRMYVNTFSLAIAPIDKNNPQATVNIEIEDIQYQFLADLFKGGQRLLLPDEARDLIIETLLQGMLVKITVGRNSEVFPPKNFAEHYEKMKS